MSKRPHLIIFNPDQYRGDVLGHRGNPAAVTPNLDRMAQTDGVSFANAYCQNPVCTPSRCSFMTGWYPHVRGHRSQLYMLRPDEPVLLQTLKDNGYFVWWGGKNDLVAGQHGYDHACHIRNKVEGQRPRAVTQYDRGEPGGDMYYSFMRGRIDKGDAPYHRDGDWGHVEDAVEFIRGYDRDEPLCLYLPLGYPHPPYAVEEPWFSMIDRDKLPPRRPLPSRDAGKAGIIHDMAERFNMTGWTEDRWDELRATYYGMCARIDHQFGLVCDALREAGMYDDSAVFFFSDHGDFTGDYCLPNKQYNVFDDNLAQVPLVIKPPADRPAQPRMTEAMAELVDFPATVFDLTGIEPDWYHFGRSLMPVITGETDTHRDAAFCEGGMLPGEVLWDEFHDQKFGKTSEYWPTQSVLIENLPSTTKATMCRTQRYKYVHRLTEKDELYDLEADPTESTNRIDDPTLAEVHARLKQRTMDFYLETADVMPRDLDRRE
ncbi:MAG: sulfatase-like hydrolase/transferase [Phycisphaeraceae bacterium]